MQIIPGVPVTTVTYAALQGLKTSNLLDTTTYYNITDRGIYLLAFDASTFQSDAARYMLCATHDVGGSAPVLGTVGKVWCPLYGIAYNIGDKAVWGGKMWVNTTGSVGTSVDDLNLDPINWTAAPFVAGVDYVESFFEITYDFDNDVIVTQVDAYNNMVGPVTVAEIANLGYNPCDVTDWFSFNYTNTVKNNKFTFGYFNNYSQIDLGTEIVNNYDITVIGVTFTPYLTDNRISDNRGSVHPSRLYNIMSVNYILGSNIVNIENQLLTDPIADSFYFQANTGVFNVLINNTDVKFVDNNTGDLIITGCTNIPTVSSNEGIQLNAVSNIKQVTGSSKIIMNSINYLNNSIVNVVNLGSTITLTTPLNLSKIEISADNTVSQYLEFAGPFNVGVQKFVSGIMIPNCRLVEAIVVCTGLTTAGAGPTTSFGVETDAIGYMPATLNSVLNTTPQRITTVSNVLTVGKRFYVQAAVSATTPSTARIRVWLKMVRS